MNSSEIAVNLYTKFRNILISYSPPITFADEVHLRRSAKDCAIVAIEEAGRDDYWQEVKEEIELI